MTDFLRRERHGAVLLLTMDRASTRNALSDPDAIDALIDACAEINADLSVRAVVLTGAHGVFSSGGNLKTLSATVGAGLGEPVHSRLAYRNGIQRVPLALYNLEVPTIAAVNGPAIGAGCDLACMCDIRLAADEARFAESFVKLGLTPGDGGAWLLPRIVGMSRACELSFTGRSIDAAQALEIGLASQVLGQVELLPAALALAQEIAQHSGHALRLTKRLLREGQHTRLDTLLEMSAGFQALAHHTEEHAGALDAYLGRTRG
ncbi:MAG: crotonase/enoyl-CoA hydratase family protein [Achromobacter veterisilvae]